MKKNLDEELSQAEARLCEAAGYDDGHVLEEGREAEKQMEEDPELREWAEKDLEEGFEELMERIRAAGEDREGEEWRASQQKQEESPAKRSGIRKRTVLLVMAAGILLAGASISSMARNGYSFEVYPMEGNRHMLFRYNTELNRRSDKLDDIYEWIEGELDIPVLMLNYIPAGMEYSSCESSRERAILRFDYKKKKIYLKEIKALPQDLVAVSEYGCHETQEVFNRWLGENLYVEEHRLESGDVEYSVRIQGENACYSLTGVVEENEFIKMTEMLSYR